MYTENYNLYVTKDGDNPTFLEWRESVAGSESSNMQKIDEALVGLKSYSVELTLTADGWNADDKTQVLSVTGLSADHDGTISVSREATANQRDVARNAMLYIVSQGTNTLTISVDGDIPTVDIPVALILFNKEA